MAQGHIRLLKKDCSAESSRLREALPLQVHAWQQLLWRNPSMKENKDISLFSAAINTFYTI